MHRSPRRIEAVLKQDSFGRVERCREADGRQSIRRVACGGRIPGSAWLARRLLERERRALERLEGLAGIPRGIESTRGELVREFQPGVALHEAEALPVDFFERLADLVARMHARGVCHNDLHKEQNVIVGPDGWPGVVDFQLSSLHRGRSRSFESRAREDLRHVEKHRRRYLREGRGPEGHALVLSQLEPLRRSWIARTWRASGKPIYRFVTRRILSTRDGEARRRSDGAWPRWTAPLGATARPQGGGSDPSQSVSSR